MGFKKSAVPGSAELPDCFYCTEEWPGPGKYTSFSCEHILTIGENLFVPGYGIRDWAYDILGLPPANRSHVPASDHDLKGEYPMKLVPDLLMATGRNRYVFAYPENPSLCIKIDKPWEVGLFNSRKWRRKRALGSWFADFSPNREELRFYCKQIRRIGERFYDHAPRFYGIVITDLGPGMVFERFCSPGSGSSQGLYDFLKDDPSRKDLTVSLVDELYKDLKEAGMRFFDWQSANLVVDKAASGKLRIVVIDWKSGDRCNSDNPINHLVPLLAGFRFQKLYEKLRRRIIEGSLKISTAAVLSQDSCISGDVPSVV
jgi:hypothetical protein